MHAAAAAFLPCALLRPRAAERPRPCAACAPRAPPAMAAGNARNARTWAPRVENRAARMRYHFLETFECGVELAGTEVKAVRAGSLNIKEGYARVVDGELWLYGVHITPWRSAGTYFNHEALRTRRLLLHKREILKLASKQKDTGLTLVPTKAYFNTRGFLKVEIALAKGKQLHDRRQDIKKRQGEREMRAIVKASMHG